MAIKAGLIGCGSIGTVLAKFMDSDRRFELAYLLDDDIAKCESLSSKLKNKPEVVIRTDDMKGADIIIEAASQQCVKERMIKAASMADVLIMSVGAFSDMNLFGELKEKAEKSGHRIYIPSGAVAGLDGIRAAAQAGLKSVTLTTRKHPRSLEGAPWVIKQDIPVHAIRKPEVIFNGSAKHAAEWFPQNVNVAITLSLAGIGAEQTKVKIIADPFVSKNVHEITAEGKFGTMTMRLENNPSPKNRKTSYLAALSAVATLKRIAETVQVGT